MRYGIVNTARAQHYDRNAAPVTAEYSNGAIAPHAAAERWTETVPAGRKLFFNAKAQIIRDGANGGAAGYASCAVLHDPSGGEAEVTVIRAHTFGTAVGAQDDGGGPAQGRYADAGDVVRCVTSDAGAGGTFRFEGSMDAEEFDD